MNTAPITTAPTTAEILPPIGPAALAERVQQGRALMLDVREPDEFTRERIGGSRPLPLSTLGRLAPPIAAPAGADLVFLCRTGNRTNMAAARLASLLPLGAQGYVLEGGIEAWKAAGLAVEQSPRAPLPMMQQVQISAGTIILLGVLLTLAVSPWFLAVPGFVGAGLVFAGMSGWCGMTRVLALMPWNRGGVSGT
ncbi:MAG: rhodanese family protein [Alphaproteobacteria bacterium]|nr:rhodanese family protein [Alphaproteobacteria bacterium]